MVQNVNRDNMKSPEQILDGYYDTYCSNFERTFTEKDCILAMKAYANQYIEHMVDKTLYGVHCALPKLKEEFIEDMKQRTISDLKNLNNIKPQ